MRKLIYQIFVSLDGSYQSTIEGQGHLQDREYYEYFFDLLSNIDALLFTGKTYIQTEEYYSSEHLINSSPLLVQRMNELSKVVYSKSSIEALWNNTTVIKENLIDEIIKLKEEPGEDILLLGSTALAKVLLQLHLIDDFRIIINPVISSGKTLFKNFNRTISFQLINTITFRSGLVMLCYKPLPVISKKDKNEKEYQKVFSY